jgi:hypothetical protein
MANIQEKSVIPEGKVNGEVLHGDIEYDGRVVLYIIKGILNLIIHMPI